MKIDYRELKKRIRLSQLLDHIGWKNTEGRGDQLRGPCPLPSCSSSTSTSHAGSSGKHREFSVNNASNVYRCFRCSAAGNALDFWKTYRNTTLQAAAIELQQFLSTNNHTAISNQPAIPQRSASHPAKLADS
jgi:hypothetical protein